MTMTAEREADAPPDNPDSADDGVIHRAELAALTGKGEQVRYAWAALGGPEREVKGTHLKAFLTVHGADVSPAKVYAELKALRAEHGQPDTGTLPMLTDDMLAAMDADRARRTQSARPVAPTGNGHQEPVPVEPLEFQSEDSSGPARSSDSSAATGIPVEPGLEDSTGIPAAVPVDVPVGAGEPVARPAEPGPAPVPVPDSSGEVAVPVSIPVEFQPQAESVPVEQPVPVEPAETAVPVETAVRVGQEPETPGQPAKSRPWTKGLYVSAFMCLLMSLNTSWRFAGDHLHIENLAERAGLFLVLETFLVSCAAAMYGAARRGTDPGPVRLAVWAGAGVGVWMALGLELGSQHPDWWAAGTRLLIGPIGSVVALHLALGIEKRERRAKAGTRARVGRELRERFLSRLGLADDERDAAQLTRDRAATRAVELSLPGWRFRRMARLQKALLAARADDAQMRERLMARRTVVHSARQFAELTRAHPGTSRTPPLEPTKAGSVPIASGLRHVLPAAPPDRLEPLEPLHWNDRNDWNGLERWLDWNSSRLQWSGSSPLEFQSTGKFQSVPVGWNSSVPVEFQPGRVDWKIPVEPLERVHWNDRNR